MAAEGLARSLVDTATRAEALGEVALALVQVDSGRACDLFNEAVELSTLITPEWRWVRTVPVLVRTLAYGQQFDAAARLAYSITMSYGLARAEALRIVAAAFAKVGDSRADAAFGQAFISASSIHHEESQVEAFSKLAATMALAHDRRSGDLFTKARDRAFACKTEHTRSQALQKLVRELIRVEHFEQAEVVARSIEDSAVCAHVLHMLTAALARKGIERAKTLFREQIALSRSVQDKVRHGRSLGKVVQVLARNRYFTPAERIARSIVDTAAQATALGELAGELACAGESRATSILDEARQLLARLRNPNAHAESVRDIAFAIAGAGMLPQAQEMIDLVWPASERTRVLIRLIDALIRGERFVEARAVADGIPNQEQRAAVLCDLASAVAQIGGSVASTYFADAEIVSWSISSDEARISRLAVLAAAMKQAGESRATTLLAEIEATAWSDHDIGRRARTLGSVAAALAETADPRATTLFNAAIAVAKTIDDSDVRARTLQMLAAALANAQMFPEAEATVMAVENSGEQMAALQTLLSKLIEAGDDRVGEVAARALDIARSIPDVQRRVVVLGDIASVLAQVRHQQASDAAREAQEAVRSMSNSYFRQQSAALLASKIVRSGMVVDALTTVEWQELDEMVRTISEWAPVFERAQQGQSVAILGEVIQSIGWVNEHWRQISFLFESPTGGAANIQLSTSY